MKRGEHSAAPRPIHLKQFLTFRARSSDGRITPEADIRLRRNIGRFGPILLQKSVLEGAFSGRGLVGLSRSDGFAPTPSRSGDADALEPLR